MAKKPYTKPEFRFERAFETMALSCGKIRASQALCRFNRKNFLTRTFFVHYSVICRDVACYVSTLDAST